MYVVGGQFPAAHPASPASVPSMPDPSLWNKPDAQELATTMPAPITSPPAMSDTGVNGSPVFSPRDQVVR